MITAAKFLGYNNVGPGKYSVHVEFTNDAAPTTTDEWFEVTGATLTEAVNDMRRKIAARNVLLSTKDVLAAIAVNTAIPITAPAAPADPTPAKTSYLAAAAYLARLVKLRADLGAQATGQLDTDITAAKVAAGGTNYQTAYLQ